MPKPAIATFAFLGGVTAATLQAELGPSATESPTCFVDEFAASYKWTPGSAVAVDGFRVIGHTGGDAGRWILIDDAIHMAPSRGATWAQLVAARAAMAYHGAIVCAAEAWTADVGDVGVTNCPNGTHEIWQAGATINSTIALSPGTVPQNGIWYNNGGTLAPIASTTLNGNVAAGAVQIVVTSAVGFAVDGWFRIQRGIAYTRTYRVIAIAGTTITIDRPLRRPFNNGDTIEVITAARDITIEGNGVTITGQADAIWQLGSGVNCHFLDIKARFTTAKFNCCFDLGSRDCTADNVDVDGNAAIPTCFLVHNAENVDLYDCRGTRAGGAGQPTVLSFASNDGCHDWSGYYTQGAFACRLSVEDLTDTFGCRSCTFNDTFFGGATGPGVEVLNSSAFNTFFGCESSNNQSGWSFTGGNGPANGNALVGCVGNRNSQIAIVAGAATVNRAVDFNAEGNVVGVATISGGSDFSFVDLFVNDTSTAAATQGLVLASGAGSIVRVSGGYATTTRNAQHFMQVDGAATALGEIDGNFRFVVATANNALILIGNGVGRLDGNVRVTSAAGFGVFLNGATAYARIGDAVDLSGAGTPIQISAGQANRGAIALTAAVPVAVAFGDTKATDRFLWSYQTNVGATGVVITGAPVVGTGFNIVGLAGDTSTINYKISS